MGQLYKGNCLVMESGGGYAAGTGISISSGTISNSGVTTVNGERGDITIQEGVDVHTLTEKTVPAGDDELLLADSADGYDNKKMTVSNFIQGVIYGDGRDGNCVIDSDATICAKEYQFKNLTICSGVTLRFCGEGVPIIRVSECFCNLGEIDLYAGHYIKDTTEAHSSTMGTIKGLHNIPGGKVPDVLGGGMGGRFGMSPAYVCDDSCDHNYGRGGDGGGEGESGTKGCGTGYYGCAGRPGGNAGVCSGGGGGGGGFCCNQFPAGCNGCDGGNCIGGNGGNSCGGGGGGGYGYLKGGDGGCSISFTGGNGGDSMYCGGNGGYGRLAGGNGGWGYYCCGGDGGCASDGANCWETVETRGVGGGTFYGTPGKGGYPNGKGGMGVFVNGADGIECTCRCVYSVSPCRCYFSGDGGDSIFCTGGRGGNGKTYGCCTVHGGNGGRGRNGGDGGSIPAYQYNPESRTHMVAGNGGDAWGNIYGLGLFINHGYNNCINASGGNGGNAGCVDYWCLVSTSMGMDIHGRGMGGNGADGGIVYLISKDFDEGCIDVSGGKGGCGAYSCCCSCYICPEVLNGKDGKDGCIKRFSDWVL